MPRCLRGYYWRCLEPQKESRNPLHHAFGCLGSGQSAHRGLGADDALQLNLVLIFFHLLSLACQFLSAESCSLWHSLFSPFHFLLASDRSALGNRSLIINNRFRLCPESRVFCRCCRSLPCSDILEGFARSFHPFTQIVGIIKTGSKEAAGPVTDRLATTDLFEVQNSA